MKTLKKYFRFTCIFLLLTFLVPEFHVLANTQPQLKSRFGDWSVFTHSTGDRNICYIASTPIKQDPKDKNWTPNFFISSNHFYAFGFVTIISLLTYLNSIKFKPPNAAAY